MSCDRTQMTVEILSIHSLCETSYVRVYLSAQVNAILRSDIGRYCKAASPALAYAQQDCWVGYLQKEAQVKAEPYYH